MKKRKRSSEDVAGSVLVTPVTGKQSSSAPLSNNWLKLQAILGKQSKGPFRRKSDKTSKIATSATPAGVDAKESDVTPVSLRPTCVDCSITRVLALDCEMVGVGPEGKRNALARVSLVNMWGNVVYDKHVRPLEFVTDFRTKVSGVRARDLRKVSDEKKFDSMKYQLKQVVKLGHGSLGLSHKAEDFLKVQKEVAELLKDRILVGHAVHNDLKVLLLSHPRKDIRDTQLYGAFRSNKGRPYALKHLAALHLGAKIQEGEHDSVEDARAALFLYRLVKEAWEENIKLRRKASKCAHPVMTTPIKEQVRRC